MGVRARSGIGARRERTTHAFDESERRTKTTNPRGFATEDRYDGAGQLTEMRDARGGTVGFAYDAAGRRTGMADATGATGWRHDGAGRTTRVSSPRGTIAYAYDGARRREAMTLPGGRTVAHGYDRAGQLTSVEDWAERETTFAHTGFGAPAEIRRPNGVRSASGYDRAGWLEGVSHYAAPAAGGAARAEFGYGLDANGNRTRVRSGAEATDPAYDAADQLTGLSGATTLAYGYDLAGNRTSAAGDTFRYDWRNRLAGATVGGTTTTSALAGDGVRVSRSTGGATTPLLWDREAAGGLTELVDDGTAVYLQTEAGALAAVDPATGSATYPLADGLGSARSSGRRAGTPGATRARPPGRRGRWAGRGSCGTRPRA